MQMEAQPLTNENNYECGSEYLEYIKEVMCDEVVICRSKCHSCEEYYDCDDIEFHETFCYYICPWCNSHMTIIEKRTHSCNYFSSESGSSSGSGNGGGGGGSGGGGDGGGGGGKSNNVGKAPSNPQNWKQHKMQDLKNKPGVTLVSRHMPNTFQQQKHPMECVANSIAIVAEIVEGTDPQKTRADLYAIAREAGYNIKEDGIPMSEIRYFLFDDYAITNDNKFSRKVVESYIEKDNKPVMAILDVIPNSTPYVSSSHMVVIVGYDAFNYYCAAGYENPVAIPKSEFEIKTDTGIMKYDIYFYNGKK